MSQTATAARSDFGQAVYDGLEELSSNDRLSASQLEVVYALAYAHVAQHQYAQALSYFAFLTQYGPTRKHYLAGLALCLQMVGRYDEAISIYSLIVALFPDSIDATLRIGECQLAMQDYDHGRDTLAMVLDYASERGGHAEAAARAEALLGMVAKEARAT